MERDPALAACDRRSEAGVVGIRHPQLALLRAVRGLAIPRVARYGSVGREPVRRPIYLVRFYAMLGMERRRSG